MEDMRAFRVTFLSTQLSRFDWGLAIQLFGSEVYLGVRGFAQVKLP